MQDVKLLISGVSLSASDGAPFDRSRGQPGRGHQNRNDWPYGLSSSVFTSDSARGLRVAAQVEAGMCHINGPTVHDEPNMPFGGVKDSGYGRFGGKAAVAEFTDLKWVSIQIQPRHYPF